MATVTDTARLEPTTGSRRAVSALVLLPACVACFALTVLIEAGVWGAVADQGPDSYPGWTTALAGVVFAVCAAVVLRREPRQGLGWALGAVGLFWATDGVSESWVRLAMGREEPLVGVSFAAWYLFRLTALLPASVAVLLVAFPDGRLLPGRWGLASRVSMTVLVVSGLLFVVIPSSGMSDLGPLPTGVDLDPTSVQALAPVAGPLRSAALVTSLLALLVVCATVVVRYRRADGIDRERMRWLVWAVVAMVLISVFTGVVDLGGAEAVAFFVVVTLVPVAMTVAVVNPRVVSIDDLLGGTLVYGGISLGILVVDVAALAVLTRLAGESLGERQVVLVVLLLSAVLYNPLRVGLWSLVRRRVLGERDDPYDVVARLASSLEAADEEAEQLTAVAESVAVAFGVSHVSVEVERADGERVVATYGTAVSETRSLPITYRGEEVGRLVLPARGFRARLSARDQRLLSDLVRQAATVSRTGRLAEQLQENKQRLVVAREEERRRIHHDLHEDLGPSLGALVYQVETARLLLAEHPEEAKATIARTSAQLRDVVADVRRVVHDLRPPALDDLGLVGALRQQAKLLDEERLRVTVVGEELAPLPAGVEVAAYRIASELLGHGASLDGGCELRLETTGTALVVDADTAPDPEDYLAVVRSQAVEVGGRCETGVPGRVRVTLPVRRTS